MEVAIQCENIIKDYSNKGRKIRALDKVSIQVPERKIFGLLGPNGAGKTTLVKIFATLLLPDAGTASICGYDVLTDEKEVQNVIGYVGQDTERSAYYRLTVKDNLLYFSYGLRAIPRKDALRKIEELASMAGFASKLNRLFISLSGGERQLVTILRALIHEPRVLLLDEPTKSLDPIAAKQVRSYIRDRCVKEMDMTILLTTHNMIEAEDLCDEIILINEGRILFQGTSTDLTKKLHLPFTITIECFESNIHQYIIQELDSFSGVISIKEDKNNINIFTEAPNNVLPEILSLTKKLELEQKINIMVYKPSLENAFVKAILKSWGRE